jgi:integrase
MAAVKFPQRVKRGSCGVTIYETPSKGRELYTLCYYAEDGRRLRPTFSNYADAKQHADEVVEKLARGQADVLTLNGHERAVYTRAIEALGSSGVSLDSAVQQFVEATKLLNGASLLEAAKVFAAQQPAGIIHKRVSEVVEELLAAKKEKGRSALYIKDLRLRLTRFGDAFACPIANVTSADIERFLQSLNLSARSTNNFRLVVGTLVNFAKKRGYVAQSHRSVLDVEKETEDEGEVEVFNAAEIRALLAHAKDDLLAAVAIGAFAGLRSEEIRRLDWADVNIQEGHIEVRAAIAKTRVRRIVPIQPNLEKWLMPHVQKNGPVCAYSNYGNQLAKLAKNAGVDWKKNGLRHSYISYRVAATDNIHQTAIEAGNTPAVIMRNYLKCVTKKQARKWFLVKPTKVDGVVVPMVPAVIVSDASQAPESERQFREAGRTS